MKKWMIVGMVFIFTFAFGITAFAADYSRNHFHCSTGYCSRYVDDNGDGICDHCTSVQTSQNGHCGNYGGHHGWGHR